ncbi:TPA: macrolide transporter subunit MacA [Serratia fonticola]|uniref:Macrolide-specific efflux protein macA n=1 Tax=Serratia fonticola TaxID=47917 RepID=A0A3S4XIP3_SERFO|nr:macrolide transporter subunit MacA [Serratia fonticola]MBL5824583.1 macrolide transporter subunit MacA [Serratia fonticola]MDK2375994.1 macrolide transporter subunit MacA [Serratia fonticola]CAI0725281.1 Macrolide-specific efflux protein macA precursor [Serratia fonticola]CAI0726126.1 Macrolide-specific efflux protein macA precursor [Serratia fonticola]CAI1043886.1 Macrolide-specific efflux protein macA precursor [Serratia fonticola]
MTWLFKSKKRGVLVCAVLVVLAVVAYWHFSHPAPVEFKTVKVAKRDLEQSVLATGQLDAVRKVDVGAQVSGQLESLKVEIGDKVQKGQLLGIIDPEQAQNSIREGEATLQQLQAQLQQALAEQQLAAVTLQRNRELAKVQAVSRQDLDKFTTELAVKKAQVETTRAQIAKNQASLDTAKINLAYTRIEAPMDGDVVQITTLQGQTVIAAQQAPNILTLADMSSMMVKAQVSEADVIHLKPGLKAWFTVLGDPSKRFDGELKDIQPTPEKVNNAIFYYARFEVPNPQGLLRLQMTAQVHIQLAGVSDALVIPLAALGDQIADNRYHISVLKQGKEEKREVTIGIRNNVDVQIVSGLQAGEEVIVSRGGAEAS